MPRKPARSTFSKPNRADVWSRKASTAMYELSKLLDSDDPALRQDAIDLMIGLAKVTNYHLNGRSIAKVTIHKM